MMTREKAKNFNFAPTVLRRLIDISDLLGKRVLDQCHDSFEQLLP